MNLIKTIIISVCFSLSCFTGLSYGGEVQVIDAKLTTGYNDYYHLDVTLKHADTGWEHYADRWEVLDLEGKILATRILYHPHVNVQPFTRGMNNVFIPTTLKKIRIRGHDLIHGYGAKEFVLSVPR